MDEDPTTVRAWINRRVDAIARLLRGRSRARAHRPHGLTISMAVDEAFALRAEAASAHCHVDEVVTLAIECLRRDAPHPRLIVEPGTSETRPGVEELTLSLKHADATWVSNRATQLRISVSAVIGEALAHFRIHGPPLSRHPEPWATTVRSRQDGFYRELQRISEDLSAGRCTADVAEARLASAFVGRVLHVVPRSAWMELSGVVREFCVNYPPLRDAHRRWR